MSTMKEAAEPSSSLRRISEDKHLRSFLSTHFNSNEYVADIIRQGKSEEISAEINKSMEDVKE
jgi:REP element-mobilizing transposase RayT